MSDIPIPQRDIGEIIKIAINEVGGSEGASLEDIERYLTSTLNDVPDSERIQSILNSDIANGFLLKLDNGKYKINGSLERAEAASENVNCDEKVRSKPHREDLNKAKGLQDMIGKRAKEDVQEVERTFDRVDKEKKRNTDPDVENVGSSVAGKVDANVPLPHDDGKQKTTAKCEYSCRFCRCAKKAVPEKEQTAVKFAQDANKKADSIMKNVDSAEKEGANVPLPDDDGTKDIEKKVRDMMKDK